jgi:hypothetical protein
MAMLWVHLTSMEHLFCYLIFHKMKWFALYNRGNTMSTPENKIPEMPMLGNKIIIREIKIPIFGNRMRTMTRMRD